MNKAIVNFGPGPSYVDPEVNKRFVDVSGMISPDGFMGTGMPIGSISHRSPIFLDNVLKPLNELVREFLEVPDNYNFFWTRDGATEQWSRIARNFRNTFNSFNYINTGDFAQRAIKPHKQIFSYDWMQVNIINSNESFTYIPTEKVKKNSLTHITWNNTVEGVEFKDKHLEYYSDSTIIADITSNMFSCKILWEEHNVGMVYGSTTKQLGGAGSCLVIIRDDLLEQANTKFLSDSESYKVLVEKDSGLYTSNVEALLKAKITLEFYKSKGGVAYYEEINKQKAKILYDVIDLSNGFYKGHARGDSRSLMNVVFYLNDKTLTGEFLEEAEKCGLFMLKGHKILPHSIRASIYNMMPIEFVERLAKFMKDFAEYCEQT